MSNTGKFKVGDVVKVVVSKNTIRHGLCGIIEVRYDNSTIYPNYVRFGSELELFGDEELDFAKNHIVHQLLTDL